MLYPRITSTSFITGTGFIKCIPITLSPRLVAAAMRVMEILEVLVARMQSAFVAWSRSVNIFSFKSMFSVAASTTRSTCATAAFISVLVLMREMAAALSASVNVPFATCRSMFLVMVSMALSSASWRMSTNVTGYPLCANTWAIPFPIWPEPITAICCISELFAVQK